MEESNDKKNIETYVVQKRWTAGRKKAAVLRLLSGESLDDVSRDLGITIAEIEGWRQRVLDQMEALLKCREENPFSKELDAAKKRVGELCMENELLKERSRRQGVFWAGR